MNFPQKVLSTVGYRSLAFVLGIWVSILTYRGLGPEHRGILAYIVFMLGLVTSFSGLGTSTSATYLLGSSQLSLRELKRAIQSMALVLTAVFWGVAYYYFWIHIDLTSGAIYSGLRQLVLIVLPMAIFAQLWVAVVYAENRIEVLNRSSVVTQIVSAILLSGAYVFDRLTLSFVFFTIVVSHGVQTLYLLQAAKPVASFGLDKNTLKLLLSQGLRSYVGDLAAYANYRISYFLVTDVLGATALGVYSLAILLTEKVLDVTKATSLILLPEIARSKANAHVLYRTNRIVRINFVITLLISGVAVGLAPMVIPILYGKAYAQAGIYLIWLLPGIILLSVAKILAAHLCGIGKIWSTSWPMIITLVPLVSALHWLLPRWGLVGASIVTSLNHILISAILLYAYLHHTEQRFVDLVRTRPSQDQVIE